MKTSAKLKLTAALVVIAFFTLVCASGTGGDGTSSPLEPLTALLSELSGKVQVLKQSEGVFQDATANTQIEIEDQVITGDDGRVRVDLSNGTIIRLSPLSSFTLKQIENTEEGAYTKLEMTIGRLWIILRGGVLEVDTPSGLASVRGSYLHVWVDPATSQTMITCLEGTCTLGNEEGSVSLTAGQTAVIKGTGEAPQMGDMTDEDVQEWLQANPEATLVVVPLTPTSEKPVNTKKPTHTSTFTPEPSLTFTATTTNTPTETSTPTTTGTAVSCGPPAGWVLHTVVAGETLQSLSIAYRVSVTQLQEANCRGTSTYIVPGEKLYVPNVATSTPTYTPTKTATPTKTSTVIVKTPTATTSSGGATATKTPTKTPKPTATFTSTPKPTNAPTVFSAPEGPDGTTITDPLFCANLYKITATDGNGISAVKLIYTLNNTTPDWNTAISAGKYYLMSNSGAGVYAVTATIDARTATLGVVKYRFAVQDSLGNIAYNPASGAYSFTDTIGCSSETNASLINPIGPDGTTISAAASCPNDYSIDVTDPDGIAEVKLLYTADGTNPKWDTAVTAGTYELLTLTGTNTYGIANAVLNSSYNAGTTNVLYRFAVKDDLGNIQYDPALGINPYKYTDKIDCGAPTTWYNLVSPDNFIIPSTDPTACLNTYKVSVTDLNGINNVMVAYVVSDSVGTPVNSNTFNLTYISGDTYGLTDFLIDASGFTVPITVNFEFQVTDDHGNLTTIFSGSFTDEYGCHP